MSQDSGILPQRFVQQYDALQKENAPKGELLTFKNGTFYIRGIDGFTYVAYRSKFGTLFWRKLRYDTDTSKNSPAQREYYAKLRELGQRVRGMKRGPGDALPPQAVKTTEELTGWKATQPRHSLKEEKRQEREAMLAKSVSVLAPREPPMIILDRISEFALLLKGG